MIEVSLASLFFSCVSLFSYWVLQTEYNLYWFISNAGLPPNISSLCSKNSTDPDCEIYNSEVVPNLATMNICGSVISLVVLSFTCWLGTLSDQIGRRKVLLLNHVGMLLMLGSASLFAKLDLNPYYFLISSFMYDSTGGFGITLGVAFASITVHS